MTVWEAIAANYETQANRPARVRRPSVVAARLATLIGWLAGVTVRNFRKAKQVALTVGGLGCLTAGAFTLGLGWGLAASGVALLTLEWLTSDGPAQ